METETLSTLGEIALDGGLMFLLMIGSFAPAILLTFIVYQVDLNREPLSRVALAFVIGVISPLITLELSNYTMALPTLTDHHPFVRALLSAAIPEELGRLALLGYLCHSWRAVDEPFDCVVYASAIWLGFSAIETSLYASIGVESNFQAILIMSSRASLCAIGHLSYGIIIASYLAVALYANRGFWPWILRGLMISIFLHTLYDGLLFSLQDFGGSWKLGAAIVADGLTMILALLFLMKLSKIQQISHDVGGDHEKQARLIARHAPDRELTLNELLGHFGLKGLLKVCLVLFLTSVFVMTILLFLSTWEFPYLAIVLIVGTTCNATWKSILKDTRRLHHNLPQIELPPKHIS